MGWSLLPNALRLFKIYCAPSNLGIARAWMCRLNFAQSPIFFQVWGSLTSPKSQTRDPQLKVPPPGGLVLRIFTSWKNPSTSANLGSQGEHVTLRPPTPTEKVKINVKKTPQDSGLASVCPGGDRTQDPCLWCSNSESLHSSNSNNNINNNNNNNNKRIY